MQMDVFPGFAVPDREGAWRVLVSGVIRQPYVPTMRKRMLIRMLGSLLEASGEQLASPEFVRRVSPFVSDAARKLDVAVALGGQDFALRRRTRRNGHFQQWLPLPPRLVEGHRETDQHGRSLLRFRACCDTATGRIEAGGEAWLFPADGWSVVSDVDDTIKESAIGDRRRMLVNTFLREFEAVEGMAPVYGRLAGQGAGFHYVSSSPCQLLHPLREWLDSAGFPGGSLHLREFRLRNHVLQKMARIRRSGKLKIIRRLVQSQPGRRFLLVGDAGESDIDLYRRIAKRFPRQVRGVFIRRLAEQPFPAGRMERLREQCPGALCADFATPDQLERLVERLFAEE